VSAALMQSYDLLADDVRIEVKLACGYMNFIKGREGRDSTQAYHWDIQGVRPEDFDSLLAILVNPRRLYVVELPAAVAADRVRKGRIGVTNSPRTPYEIRGWIQEHITYEESA
jgi:hypothetical protein